jgi:glycosyltransferase involved in cell wall biosynthesis
MADESTIAPPERPGPLVSIITPSFNHCRYIEATIRSVRGQGYAPIEHIVMDGASTDGTVEVLERLAREAGTRVTTGNEGCIANMGAWQGDGATPLPNPPPKGGGSCERTPSPVGERAGERDSAEGRGVCEGRSTLRIFSAPDRGQADAIARGIARSSGEIVTWLNSDDLLADGAIDAVVRYFEAHPNVALVYGQARFVDARGRDIGPCTVVEPYDRERLFHVGDYIIQPAAFFRQSAYEAVGGLDASLRYAMDWDLWLKLAKRFDVGYLPRVLAYYRWQGQNKSATGAWERLEEVAAVARRHGVTRLPAYFALEKAALHASFAMRGNLGHLGGIARTLLDSPRAVRELLDPHTWDVILTGQTLRRRARARG